MKNTKFIFITGGVVSSLGKGITSSCIGRLLKNRGLKIFMQKFDPYLNYAPGTLSPFQHGEVYITHDGGEADLDLGHYERFTNENVTKHSDVTSGIIYSSVIEKERRGYYNGGTVQVIPHITNEILSYLHKAKETGADVVLTEIGGTVGDMEGLPYLEAIRQARRDFGYENTFYVHCTLVPYLKSAGEIKTKPTQHSVKELKSIGITPDMIMLRSEVDVPKYEKKKIALFCDVKEEAVIEAKDVDIIYRLVNNFHDQGVDDIICDHFKLETSPCNLGPWNEMISRIENANGEVKIGLVGKYISLKDAYLSVYESLDHSANSMGKKCKIKRIESDSITAANIDELLGDVDGILVPAGSGSRGVEGAILASKYAREKNIPYFGICLGMQIGLIDVARNVCGLTDATSTEFDVQSKHKIVEYYPIQPVERNNGTMKLGDTDIKLVEDSKVFNCYGKADIVERHQHKYEFNNEYKELLEKAGVKFVGTAVNTGFVEAIEIGDLDWYVACQYHPQFNSRPNHPHPLFDGFIAAAIKKQEK